MSECFSEYFIKSGEFLPKELFPEDEIKKGRSAYEVLRVVDGIPMFLESHIARLVNSVGLINKKMLLNEKEIRENISDLIRKESKVNGNIKIVFNYGEHKYNYFFYFLKHAYPTDIMYKEGVDTILYHGERENPNAKVMNAAFREKVENAIKEKGVYEAILVDREGFITEGSKSNIFMIYDNKVITSPLEAVLPGVTRGTIISIIKEANIPFSEEKYHYSDLDKLQGLFISGTSPKVLPVRRVDNYNYNSSNNTIINEIMDLFNVKTQKYIELDRK